MRKNTSIKINTLISIVIIIGFIVTGIISYSTYSKIIKNDIKNISKLTSMNIYSEINNELTKPIFVSLTMANDSFLKNWLSIEDKVNTIDHYKQLQNYLIGIKLKYGYDSTFLVSTSTSNYYTYKGIEKRISKNNAHDIWYFDFINKNLNYDLDVDTDEVSDNALTVFINCRVEDAKNNLLGVVGVGLKINEIQKMLKTFEDNYGLEVFLISPDGIVEAHTNSNFIEKLNIFDDKTISNFKNEIQNNHSDLLTFKYKDKGIDGYIITRYIDELNWYLVVKKDTSILKKSLYSQLFKVMAVMISVIIFTLIISTKIINWYKQKLSNMAKTDYLTNLPNRRGFNEFLNNAIENHSNYGNDYYVFVFDIDDFKSINDNFGHLFGDHVIRRVAKISNKFIEGNGMLARWGGDEFSGVLFNIDNLDDFSTNLLNIILNDVELKDKNITISLGITKSKALDTRDTIIYRADQGMYYSKEHGKNQYKVN